MVGALTGDTIVALSSPPGTSGLAVVRVSGPASRSLIRRHLGREVPGDGPSDQSQKSCLPRHVYYGAFRVPAENPASLPSVSAPSSVSVPIPAPLSIMDGRILDRLNFVFFPGPASSTGEDVLELYPHGNMLLVDGIFQAMLANKGVRLAEAGEFTRRGFENGKIDLLQAEAIGELIHAQTAEALNNAQRIVSGELSGPLKALRSDLLDLSARLELDVDFSEEEADPDYPSWIPRLEKVLAALGKLAGSFEKGRGFGRARRVAILGAPNAGKSSLINALVEQDRLLVSSIPGTTRDYVEVPLRLPGGMVHLVDTAGLGIPVDGLDEMAMQRTRQQSQKADIRIWIEDGTDPAPIASEFAPESLAMQVNTKMDLQKYQSKPGYLGLSSVTGEGLAEFRSRLNALVFADQGQGEDIALTTERQFRAVEAAKFRVQAALECLRHAPAMEIIAFEIREAMDQLQELLGEISSDEILQKVFSGYCIGK